MVLGSFEGYLSFSTIASSAGTVIKASPGRVFGWSFHTIDATPVYVKLYDSTVAPSSGSTPKVRVAVAGSTTVGNGPQSVFGPGDEGIYFSSGISYIVVTGLVDNSTLPVTANETLVNIFYR